MVNSKLKIQNSKLKIAGEAENNSKFLIQNFIYASSRISLSF